jgi:hypothetical protein
MCRRWRFLYLGAVMGAGSPQVYDQRAGRGDTSADLETGIFSTSHGRSARPCLLNDRFRIRETVHGTPAQRGYQQDFFTVPGRRFAAAFENSWQPGEKSFPSRFGLSL